MALVLGRGMPRLASPAQNPAVRPSPQSTEQAQLDENNQAYLNERGPLPNGHSISHESPKKSPPQNNSFSTPHAAQSPDMEDDNEEQLVWASAPNRLEGGGAGPMVSAQRYLVEIESVISEKRVQLQQLRKSNEQRKLSIMQASHWRNNADDGVANLGSHFSSATTTHSTTTPARNIIRSLDQATSSTRRTPASDKGPNSVQEEGSHAYLMQALRDSRDNEIEAEKKITELKKRKEDREDQVRSLRSEVDQLLAEVRVRDEREHSLREMLEDYRKALEQGGHYYEHHTTEIHNGGPNNDAAINSVHSQLRDIAAQLQHMQEERDKLTDEVMQLQEDLAFERVKQPTASGRSTVSVVWIIVIIWLFILLAIYSYAVDFMPNTIDRYRLTW